MNIDAKAREIASHAPMSIYCTWEQRLEFEKIIAAALLSARDETEAATWAAAEAIARDYDDWTYWGQYDNATAAGAAAIEIAEALAKRRPLTTEEIQAIDPKGHKTAGSEFYLNKARNEALEEAAKFSEGIWLDAHDTDFDLGVNATKREIATAVRALKATTG